MLRNKKRRIKIDLIIGVILLVILGSVVILMNRLNNSYSITKIVDLDIQDGSADYLEMLLETENGKDPHKIILLRRDAVEQVIQYMRDNDVRIVPGKYDIPQISNYEEIMDILEFEPEKE